MGAQGTTVLDFGAFPGKADTSVAVTGQASILSGSLVEAWVWPVLSSDHSADEHLVESISLFAGNVVAGTGFTIWGFCTAMNPRDFELDGSELLIPPNNTPLLYGVWNVAWAWN